MKILGYYHRLTKAEALGANPVLCSINPVAYINLNKIRFWNQLHIPTLTSLLIMNCVKWVYKHAFLYYDITYSHMHVNDYIRYNIWQIDKSHDLWSSRCCKNLHLENVAIPMLAIRWKAFSTILLYLSIQGIGQCHLYWSWTLPYSVHHFKF